MNSCSIDTSGFKEFISQIAKHLKGLEKLDLNFSWFAIFEDHIIYSSIRSQVADDQKDKVRKLFSHIPEFKLA